MASNKVRFYNENEINIERKYNPKHYKYDTYSKLALNNIMRADFIMNTNLARKMCLYESGHDVNTTITAVEREEEYFPVLKDCVKDKLTTFF